MDIVSTELEIKDLLSWILEKLSIYTLGYSFAGENERPFGFNYPNKSMYPSVHKPNPQKIYKGIVIPNAKVNDTIHISRKYNADNFSLAYQTIKSILNMRDGFETECSICMYILLHEIGHYLHFLSLTDEMEYIAFRNDYAKKKAQISFDRPEWLSERERMILEIQYLSLPGEKEATDFAIKNIGWLWKDFMKEYLHEMAVKE